MYILNLHCTYLCCIFLLLGSDWHFILILKLDYMLHCMYIYVYILVSLSKSIS